MRDRALIAAIVLASAVARADFRAAVSPGPLAAPHAAFDRLCDKCHVPFQGIPAATCLSCHARTKHELDTGRGFHAPLAAQKCSLCHGDHKGRDHKLTPPLDERAFDHATSGFALEGRHRQAACVKCHPSSSVGQKWAGVPTTCKGCHGDTHHKGALGEKCETCHSPFFWQPPKKTREAHVVPMIGGHQKLDCAGCHAKGAHLVKTSSCGDCHEQKHGGTKAPCATCHTPLDWKKATFTHDFCTCILPGKHQTAACLDCHPKFKFNPTPLQCAGCHLKDRKHDDLGACSLCHSALGWQKKTFDHNKRVFGFPLDGKHLEVGCENCHTKGVFKGAPKNCEGCHKVPKHGDFGACAKCHATAGFAPQKFSHADTRFPLDGHHTKVACETCHAMFKKGQFEPGPNACVLCHGDPHKGQFRGPAKVELDLPRRDLPARLAPSDGAGSGGRSWTCRDCHDTKGFSPSKIDAGAHAKFAFPLAGAHAKVACNRCHLAAPGQPHGSERFVGLPTQCNQCHMDPHGGANGTDCARCHSQNAWPDTPGFDHVKVSGGFALKEAHAHVECSQCHGLDRKKLDGAPHPITCGQCHTARHGKQFGTDCASCHQPTRFSSVPKLDAAWHARTTGFPLARRHAGVPCLSCHDAARGDRVNPGCWSCHGDAHRGAMGHECGDCHAPDRWLLVRFDHDRTEFPLRGRHFVTPCTDCHRNNLWTGTRTECVTCHAKDRPTSAAHPARWDCGSAGCHVPFGWHAFTK